VPERGAELVTAVGPLLGAQVGEFLRLRGRWSAHPRYGRQFEVHSYATVLPATAAGIQKYLGSGLIKGIGLASPYMGEVSILAWGVRFVVGPLPAVRVGHREVSQLVRRRSNAGDCPLGHPSR
jgi:hypothetical protein